MNDGGRTRVAFLSYNPLVSEGLRAVLERAPAFEPAMCLNDLGEFADCLAVQRPHLALLDLCAGLSLSELHELHILTRDVQIVLWGDPTVEFGFHAMEIGIRGIIPMATPLQSIAVALNSIRFGQLWFDKGLLEQFLLTKRISLTPREGQLVSLLPRGLKNKELAYALGITEGTVKVYLSRLFKKLGVNDRFELALYALKNMANSQNGSADLTDRLHNPDEAHPGSRCLHSFLLPAGSEMAHLPFELHPAH